jgi:hypothetical protein
MEWYLSIESFVKTNCNISKKTAQDKVSSYLPVASPEADPAV